MLQTMKENQKCIESAARKRKLDWQEMVRGNVYEIWTYQCIQRTLKYFITMNMNPVFRLISSASCQPILFLQNGGRMPLNWGKTVQVTKLLSSSKGSISLFCSIILQAVYITFPVSCSVIYTNMLPNSVLLDLCNIRILNLTLGYESS